MEKKVKSIPVVFCFDSTYAKYVEVSMFSAYKNCTSDITFYCITDTKDENVFLPIKKLAEKNNFDVVFIADKSDAFSQWKESHHLTKTTYLRFLMPDLMREDKAVYLDCDVVVNGDITDLYNIDLGDNVIGGVAENRGKGASPIARTLTDEYMNAGILLMNLKAMRDMNFLEVCREFYNKEQANILWHDQDMINKILEGKKKELSKTWNFQLLDIPRGEEAWDQFFKADILHYNGPIKPWMQGCDPKIALVWWKYFNEINRV